MQFLLAEHEEACLCLLMSSYSLRLDQRSDRRRCRSIL